MTESDPAASLKPSRPVSPSLTASGERKRRRKVLSCYDCRRRKLLCDRVTPACGRCVKTGHAADCIYLDNPNDETSEEPTATEKPDCQFDASDVRRSVDTSSARGGAGMNLQSRLEEQQQRIRSLEDALEKRKTSIANSTVQETVMLKTSICPPSPDSEAETRRMDADDVVIIRGNSFKTQFHGPTHTGALLPFIPGLHQFSIDIAHEFPGLGKIRQELRRYEQPGRERIIQRVSDADLRILLPSRQETDDLVNLYLDSYGQIYHILHLPTFWSQYEELWEGPMNFDAHLVALILLLTAAAQCLADTQPWLCTATSSSSTSAARQRSDRAILAVEDWLPAQSQKHVTATDFQIRLLLLIAKQASARKFKRTWTEAGTVLRFFMSAGLHRDPAILRTAPSQLDSDLRRRLWAAAVELELQISFDRGMVPAPWPAQSDCPPPSPDASRSYLDLAAPSLPLRHALTTKLNSLSDPTSFADLKRSADALSAALDSLPPPSPDPHASPDLSRPMLELTLRQYLLALHEKFLSRQSSSSSAAPGPPAASRLERAFACASLVEQATRVMDVYRSLAERGSYALELLRNDVLRAALGVCHVAGLVVGGLGTGTGTGEGGRGGGIGDVSLRAAVDEAAAKVVEAAVEMVTEKVLRLGREQRQLWLLLAARAYLEVRREPGRRREVMARVVEGMSRPYYRVLAGEKRGLMEGLGREGRGWRDEGEVVRSAGEAALDDHAAAAVDEETLAMDMEAMAAWTFEDWGFRAEGTMAACDGQMWMG